MKPFEKGDHFDGDKLLRTRLGKMLAVMMPGVRIVYGKKVKEILAGCINSQYVLLIIVSTLRYTGTEPDCFGGT